MRIVREALDDNQDDVDAAVEFLIEMRAIGQGAGIALFCVVFSVSLGHHSGLIS